MQNEFEVVKHHEIAIELALKKFSTKILDILTSNFLNLQALMLQKIGYKRVANIKTMVAR